MAKIVRWFYFYSIRYSRTPLVGDRVNSCDSITHGPRIHNSGCPGPQTAVPIGTDLIVFMYSPSLALVFANSPHRPGTLLPARRVGNNITSSVPPAAGRSWRRG